jgi:hypothetical protein
MTALTAQQLDDIQTRANAATVCPEAEANGRMDGQHTWGGSSFTHIQCELCRFTRPRGERAEETALLLDEIRRLKTQRKYLLAQLAKRDAETGRADKALREFLAGEPDLAETVAVVEPAEACGKCKTSFDPSDTRFDGHARYYLTPFCKGCVDACHDTEIADHRCVICA